MTPRLVWVEMEDGKVCLWPMNPWVCDLSGDGGTFSNGRKWWAYAKLLK